MRKFYTDGHSRLVKWRPSVSCPLRNCLLLRRSDWCCHCWIQNHGSMLGSSYRLQIPVLQWRITPEMCQKMKMVLPENWYFVDDFPWSSFLKLEMFRFVVFFGVFETFSTIFASRRASSSRHWSYSRCGLQPHCRRCSDLTRRFVCYFFSHFVFSGGFDSSILVLSMKFALQMAQTFGNKQGLCICSHHLLIWGLRCMGWAFLAQLGCNCKASLLHPQQRPRHKLHRLDIGELRGSWQLHSHSLAGCGNTVNANDPMCSDWIVECLCYLEKCRGC